LMTTPRTVLNNGFLLVEFSEQLYLIAKTPANFARSLTVLVTQFQRRFRNTTFEGRLAILPENTDSPKGCLQAYIPKVCEALLSGESIDNSKEVLIQNFTAKQYKDDKELRTDLKHFVKTRNPPYHLDLISFLIAPDPEPNTTSFVQRYRSWLFETPVTGIPNRDVIPPSNVPGQIPDWPQTLKDLRGVTPANLGLFLLSRPVLLSPWSWSSKCDGQVEPFKEFDELYKSLFDPKIFQKLEVSSLKTTFNFFMEKNENPQLLGEVIELFQTLGIDGCKRILHLPKAELDKDTTLPDDVKQKVRKLHLPGWQLSYLESKAFDKAFELVFGDVVLPDPSQLPRIIGVDSFRSTVFENCTDLWKKMDKFTLYLVMNADDLMSSFKHKHSGFSSFLNTAKDDPKTIFWPLLWLLSVFIMVDTKISAELPTLVSNNITREVIDSVSVENLQKLHEEFCKAFTDQAQIFRHALDKEKITKTKRKEYQDCVTDWLSWFDAKLPRSPTVQTLFSLLYEKTNPKVLVMHSDFHSSTLYSDSTVSEERSGKEFLFRDLGLPISSTTYNEPWNEKKELLYLTPANGCVYVGDNIIFCRPSVFPQNISKW
jgi:hypothetical protein